MDTSIKGPSPPVHHRNGPHSRRIELANAIFEYPEIFHNRQRRHSALEMRSPIEYERVHYDNPAAAPLIQVS